MTLLPVDVTFFQRRLDILSKRVSKGSTDALHHVNSLAKENFALSVKTHIPLPLNSSADK